MQNHYFDCLKGKGIKPYNFYEIEDIDFTFLK